MFEQLQHQFALAGWFLETTAAWFGEPHHRKYIVMNSGGLEQQYFDTLAQLKQFLKTETETSPQLSLSI